MILLEMLRIGMPARGGFALDPRLEGLILPPRTPLEIS